MFEEYTYNFILIFWGLLVEMAPWLLLGFLFSGILKVYVPTQLIEKHLSKPNFSSVVKAALFGVPLPLCSCGVIPMANSLKENGVSKGAISSFLISTPQTGVDSIFATYSLLGLPFAILRVFISFVSGIIGGVLTNLGFKNERPKALEKEVLKNIPPALSSIQKLKEMLNYGFYTMVQDLGKWILIGLILATLVSILIPESFIAENLDSYWKEFVLMIIIAVPLYVCATGSIPIALSFALKGISPGAILVFLMVGPATNIATITVLLKTLGKKFTFIYLFSIISCSVLFGILINSFFTFDEIFTLNGSLHHHQEGVNYWIHFICGIILVVLLVNSLLVSNLFKNKSIIKSKNMQEFNVEGMTCNHCKSSVENKLNQFDEIKSVKVDLKNKKVFIESEDKTIKEKVVKAIIDLGFSIKE